MATLPIRFAPRRAPKTVSKNRSALAPAAGGLGHAAAPPRSRLPLDRAALRHDFLFFFHLFGARRRRSRGSESEGSSRKGLGLTRPDRPPSRCGHAFYVVMAYLGVAQIGAPDRPRVPDVRRRHAPRRSMSASYAVDLRLNDGRHIHV